MADDLPKRTHAQRRRLEAQDAVRRKLRAAQFIRRLKEIAEQLDHADPERVPALRLKADIYSRLLAKCLPDLRAVEHSGAVAIPQYVIEVPAPVADARDWLAQHAPPSAVTTEAPSGRCGDVSNHRIITGSGLS